jgi:signal transduction histidine kinase
VVRVFLPQLATDHAEKIAAHLERVDQECAVVREIARRALDSPAEMAAFEEQIELVPDLLDNHLDLLLLADAGGRVVYWQDGQRLDPATHGRRAARIPASVADADWFRRAQAERGSQFLPWGRSPYLHGDPTFRSLDPGSHHLGLVLDVPRPSGPPGVLFALLRWVEVQRVLDDARDVLATRAHLPSSAVFLVARNGVVQGHTDRAHYGARLEPPDLAARLVAAEASGRTLFVADDGSRQRVGYAPCGRGSARSFVVGVAVPEAELFAASDAYERTLWVAIAALALVLVVWSRVASHAIVAPVRRLVAASRRVAQGDLTVVVPARGGPELGELAGAFTQMARDLAAGRERLAAAEREHAWAEMARQVAHEVKNPLQPMRLSAEMLQRARADGDPRAEQIAERLARTVLEQTQELDRIANDFRAFAGSAPSARTVLAADDWLEELRGRCASLFAERPLTLTTAPGAPGCRIAVDRQALARVFVNLLQNAIDARPAGVRVRIATAVAADRVRFAVTDDGPGVPEPLRARLFEPYFTTKTSGTGLGLAICRRLVESHGGTIRLSHAGVDGTEFTIELPVVAAGT